MYIGRSPLYASPTISRRRHSVLGCPCMRPCVVWRIGGVLVSINKVNLRRALLVLGWVTVSGFNPLVWDIYLDM